MTRQDIFELVTNGTLSENNETSFSVNHGYEMFILHNSKWERVTVIHLNELLTETFELESFGFIENKNQSVKILKLTHYIQGNI